MSESPRERPTVRQAAPAPPGSPAPAEIGALFPQLEVVEVIGHGGMGVVYKARQKGLDRVVALKILPPDADRAPSFAERFRREARALAQLNHPNIVTVHDSGQVEDLFYLLMEYVDGTNLRGLMDHEGLPPDQALAIVRQICDAIQYAHDEGVMHRDIKPENVLVDRKGRVKIADFGLAKLLARPADSYTLTLPQQVMGTMHYMAPEQVESTADVDHRADIYALGVVFYEMLTGELPIGHFPLPSQKRLDTRLDQIVLRALAKEPGKRYQRIEDVKTDVEAISAASSPAAPTPRAPAARPIARGPSTVAGPERGVATAYLLWLACILGFCGLHRLYLGRWVTGLLWLLSFGVLFVGQAIDLVLIPGMVRLANLETRILARTLSDPAGRRRSSDGSGVR